MARVPDSTPLRSSAKAWRRSASALALLIALSLGAGCTTIAVDLAGSGEELTGPFPHDYREIVQRWIDSDFYDVSTVTSLQVSTPIPGHSNRWPGKTRIYGWYAKVNFKARDSVGASKGKLAYSVLIREGAVVSSRKLLY
jgi:hypothetical protein